MNVFLHEHRGCSKEYCHPVPNSGAVGECSPTAPLFAHQVAEGEVERRAANGSIGHGAGFYATISINGEVERQAQRVPLAVERFVS